MNTECYAYQIALKTLKERCSYLQNKLESVEEENCQLKLQIPHDLVKKSPRNIQDMAQLQEEITLLTEQKAQLKHQIQLVTAENQKLWSRLSRFTSASDAFVSDRDSHSCLEGHISYAENNSDLEVSKIVITPERSRESLDEISLKLNGIVLGIQGDSGKSGFREIQTGENQSPFANMIDLKADNSSIQMETFAYSTSDDIGSILNTFKNHILKLKQIKQILLNNNNDLTSTIALLKNFQKNNLSGKEYSIAQDSSAIDHVHAHEEQRENDFSTLQVHEIGIGNNELMPNVGDKICPLCEITFSGPFKEFSEHVNGHFSEEEVDITTSFELLQ